jgi:hypothetical protein
MRSLISYMQEKTRYVDHHLAYQLPNVCSNNEAHLGSAVSTSRARSVLAESSSVEVVVHSWDGARAGQGSTTTEGRETAGPPLSATFPPVESD